jgi:hypothetical protein
LDPDATASGMDVANAAAERVDRVFFKMAIGRHHIAVRTFAIGRGSKPALFRAAFTRICARYGQPRRKPGENRQRVTENGTKWHWERVFRVVLVATRGARTLSKSWSLNGFDVLRGPRRPCVQCHSRVMACHFFCRSERKSKANLNLQGARIVRHDAGDDLPVGGTSLPHAASNSLCIGRSTGRFSHAFSVRADNPLTFGPCAWAPVLARPTGV